MQMVEQALRAFAQQNFGADGEEFYPVHQRNTQEVQILALMAKNHEMFSFVRSKPILSSSLVD